MMKTTLDRSGQAYAVFQDKRNVYGAEARQSETIQGQMATNPQASRRFLARKLEPAGLSKNEGDSFKKLLAVS